MADHIQWLPDGCGGKKIETTFFRFNLRCLWHILSWRNLVTWVTNGHTPKKYVKSPRGGVVNTSTCFSLGSQLEKGWKVTFENVHWSYFPHITSILDIFYYILLHVVAPLWLQVRSGTASRKQRKLSSQRRDTKLWMSSRLSGAQGKEADTHWFWTCT